MKTLFQNAKVVDGSGGQAFFADVLVDGDRIVEIRRRPRSRAFQNEKNTAIASEGDATAQKKDDVCADSNDANVQCVDVAGKVLAPGFIDAHSHNDWFCLRRDGRERFFDTFIKQGITSMVMGNCGFSATGFQEDSPYLDDLGGELFHLDPSERFGSCEEWLDAVDKNCPVNTTTLLGHGTARLAAAGLQKVELSPKEEENMLQTLEKGLQEGAAGISLGLMYLPGISASMGELEKVASLCAKYDRILTVHPRAESKRSMSYSLLGRSHLLRAMDELDYLTRATGCHLELSHLIFVGRSTWKDVDEALEILENLERDGYKVGFDMYPKNYGMSVITVVLPDWYQQLDVEARKSPWVQFKLRILIAITTRLLGFGFADIKLAYAGEKHPEYNGRFISEIAETEGRKPVDVYLNICEDSDFKARVLMGSYQNKEIVDRLMVHPQSIYMTDAWYEEKGVQYDSIYDAFPMLLRFAREKQIPIEDTVHRMTGKTAERFRIPKRGFIREGYFADLVILDPATVAEGAETEDSPVGIEHVYINGLKVYDSDEGLLPERHNAGRAIRIG